MELLEVHLLGGFGVAVDGARLPVDAWPRRAADLVKLLALSPGHSLQRDQVADAIWPGLEPKAAFANVHKAAHLARKELGDPDAIVLRRGLVVLAPGARVETDVERFEATGDADLYAGDLLPGDRYEAWAAELRERLRHGYREALRAAERWDALAEDDPTDEEAQRALMQDEVEAGRRHAALRRFHRLREALAGHGLTPTGETLALYAEIARGPAAVAPLAAAGPVVGRERELAAARAARERAGAGHGGALLVGGEAGVGKTRLCEELLAEASADGWTTLRGVAREEEGSLPYAPVAEAIDRLLLDRPDLAAQVTEAARAELAGFSIAFPGTGATSARRPDRQRIYAAVGQLLAAAARERGAILLVDDVHAADEASIQLLHALARAARFQRLLVILAFRDEVPRPELAQARASLLEQRVAAEIRLEPLDRAASAELVDSAAGAPPAAEVEEAIWRLAGGNAFFTEELAAAILPDGTLEVPRRLYEILHARLNRLEPPVQAVLARAAVAAGSFAADELAALAGIGESEAFAVLDAALSAGIVREEPTGFRFRHGLVREALARALPSHRRAAAHRDAAERLAAAGAAPAKVAYQLLEGGRPAEAVPWLARAACAARDVAAYADALGFVDAALPHAREAQRRELLPLRADLLFATGDPTAASAYAEAVAAGCRGVPGLRASQARALLAAGDVAAATTVLTGTRARASADRARLAVTGGIVAWFRGDLEAAERGVEEGRPLALAAGLVQETMEATQLRACLAHTRGDWGGRVQRDLVETLRHPQLSATIFDAHVCVAEWVLTSGESYDELTSAARELRAAAEKSGAKRAHAFAATVLGEAELLAGRLEEAGRHLREAVAVSHEVGTQAGASLATLRLGEVALAHGKSRDAAGLLEDALRLARDSTLPDHLLYLVFAPMIRATADPLEAIALVDEAEALLTARPRCPFCPLGYWVAATHACAGAGSLDRSREYLAAAEQTAQLWPGGRWPAAIAEARAALVRAEEAAGKVSGRLSA